MRVAKSRYNAAFPFPVIVPRRALPMPAKNPKLDQFESQLAELERLVKVLEAGDTPLDEAVKHFERGMDLSRSCEKLLQQAELRVQQLSRDVDGQEQLSDMATPDQDSDS